MKKKLSIQKNIFKKNLFKWIFIYCIACVIVMFIAAFTIYEIEEYIYIIKLASGENEANLVSPANSIGVSVFYFCMACCMGIFVILTFQRQSARIIIGFLIYLAFTLLFAIIGPSIFALLKQADLYNAFLLFILGGLLLIFSILFKEYLDTTKNAPFLLASLDLPQSVMSRIADYQITIPSPDLNAKLYLNIHNKSTFPIVLRNYALIETTMMRKKPYKKYKIQIQKFTDSIFMDPESIIKINISFEKNEKAKNIEGLNFYAETNCKYMFKYRLIFSELISKSQNYFLEYGII